MPFVFDNEVCFFYYFEVNKVAENMPVKNCDLVV